MPATVSRFTTVSAAAVILLSGCVGEESQAPGAVQSPPAASPGAASADSEETPTGLELPPPELTDFRWAASGGFQSGNLPLTVAEGMNLDEKYGLNIEYLDFPGGAAQVATAMLAGQVDGGGQSAGPVVSSLHTDTPLVIHYVTKHNLTDTLFARPGIETAEDLRGGSVAISSFGAQSHAGALLAIRTLGLTENDVTLTQVGGDSDRLAALQAGSVDASINDAAQEEQLTDAGFNVLVRLAETEAGAGVPTSTFTTTVEFAEQHPDTILNIVAMLLEASVEMRRDYDATAQFLSELGGIPLEDARAEVELVLDGPLEPKDGRCTDEAIEFTRDILLAIDPEVADVDPHMACSNEALDRLADLGFQEQIGVPGY